MSVSTESSNLKSEYKIRKHLITGFTKLYSRVSRTTRLLDSVLFVALMVIGNYSYAIDYLFLNSYSSNLRFDAHSSPKLRGFILDEDQGLALELDISHRGYSAGYLYQFTQNDSEYSSSFVSFSFSTGFIDLTAGIEHFSFSQRTDETELFFEVFHNFGPSKHAPGDTYLTIFSGLGIHGDSSNTTTIKIENVSKILGENIFINPYFEIGAGDFYYTAWKPRYLDIGFDITKYVGSNLYVSGYASLLLGLKSTEIHISDSSNTQTSFGLALRYSH